MNSIRKRFALFVAIAIALFLSASNLPAQEQSTEYVPKEAFAGVLFDLDRLKGFSGAKYVPHEIISAFGKRDFGFDPKNIEQAKLIFGMNENAPMPQPEFGAILELSGKSDLAEHFEKLGVPTEVDGTKIYHDKNIQMFLVNPKPKVLLVASSEPFALLMAASKKAKTPFTKLMASTKVEAHAQVIVSVERLKSFISNLLNDFPAPPPFGALNKLHEQTQSIAIKVDLKGGGFELKFEFVGYSEKDAKNIRKTLTKIITLGKAAALTMIETQFGESDDVVEIATAAYFKRMLDEVEKQISPSLDKKTVSITLENEMASIGVLTGLLLPAVQSAREAARRTQAANNVKQLGLGFHNYHDTYKKFPSQAITDKKGKPLLSWRVELLPFLGHQELYDEFHLDEPWDSKHNIKLLDRMPPTFQNPNSLDPTKTNFLGVSGKGTMFDGKSGKSFRDILDGTSNTIMFVESNRYIPWTKPVDHEIDFDDPIKGLGSIRPGGFQAGFADGSVQFISENIDLKTLEHMFKIADGAVIRN